MISRGLKTAYYAAARGPMFVYARVYRAFFAPSTGMVRVHLGPGQNNYLPGWVNVDANIVSARPDVWADLRNALPFGDGTVDVFYSHHMIEHLADQLLPFHFSELFRCLKPGGLVRLGGPNGDTAIKKFVEGDAAWFGDFPDSRKSLGGRFANFILCRGEHTTILTESYLAELLSAAGFVDIVRCSPAVETTDPNLITSQLLALETESTPEAPHTLLVEARKPPTQ